MDKIEKRQYAEIDIDDIEVDPHNVRTESIRAGLESLKASIEKVGLIHPIVVTKDGDKKFKVIVGQRRFKAFQELRTKDKKYDKIPAIIINDVDDLTKRVMSFSENINRSRLPYNDTIRVCDELFKSYGGPKSQRLQRIADDIGVSLPTVVRYLAYRIVPEEIRDLVDEGKLDGSQAYKLTAAFWPKSDKIVRIAKYMVGMTKPEWQYLLDIGMERPTASLEEIIEESKKPSRKIRLEVHIDRSDFERLKSIADKSENKIDISDFITSIIKGYLEGQ